MPSRRWKSHDVHDVSLSKFVSSLVVAPNECLRNTVSEVSHLEVSLGGKNREADEHIEYSSRDHYASLRLCLGGIFRGCLLKCMLLVAALESMDFAGLNDRRARGLFTLGENYVHRVSYISFVTRDASLSLFTTFKYFCHPLETDIERLDSIKNASAWLGAAHICCHSAQHVFERFHLFWL